MNNPNQDLDRAAQWLRRQAKSPFEYFSIVVLSMPLAILVFLVAYVATHVLQGLFYMLNMILKHSQAILLALVAAVALSFLSTAQAAPPKKEVWYSTSRGLERKVEISEIVELLPDEPAASPSSPMVFEVVVPTAAPPKQADPRPTAPERGAPGESAPMKWARLLEWMRNIAPDVPHAELVHIVEEAHRQHPKDPALVLAMIRQESGFDKTAVSYAGARGLMQVMPRWHPEKLEAEGCAKSGCRTVKSQIAVGLHVLTEYLDAAEGNLRAAFRKYSGGAKDYTRKVLQTRDTIVALLKG